MVFNLAPIGCFPAFLTELPHNYSDLDEYGCLISYNNAVSDYNSILKEKLNLTRQLLRDAHVIYVDTHSIKLELFRHPMQHGIRFFLLYSVIYQHYLLPIKNLVLIESTRHRIFV